MVSIDSTQYTKRIEEHTAFMRYFLYMMEEMKKLTAEPVAPGLKAIEEVLLEKYHCRQLALDIEKRIEEW